MSHIVFTSANVLFTEEGERSEAQGDLPGELSVGGGEAVDDAAAGSLFAARLKGGGASHEGDQHDQHLHLRRCRRVEERTLLWGEWKSLIGRPSQNLFYSKPIIR